MARDQNADEASQPTIERRGGYESGSRPASKLKPPPEAITKPKPSSESQGSTKK